MEKSYFLNVNNTIKVVKKPKQKGLSNHYSLRIHALQTQRGTKQRNKPLCMWLERQTGAGGRSVRHSEGEISRGKEQRQMDKQTISRQTGRQAERFSRTVVWQPVSPSSLHY